MTTEADASPEAILTGLLTKAQLAALLGKSERTIDRWKNTPGGLPFIPMGSAHLFNVASVREWLLRRETQRGAPGGRRRRVA